MAAAANSLGGRRLLLVEDDYLIAADLAASLAEMGALVIGPMSSIDDALDAIASSDRIDAAVLDVNLNGQRIYPVADALREHDVPFVFTTGYEAEVLPPAYRAVPRCDKPIDISRLIELLESLKRQPEATRELTESDSPSGDVGQSRT
jgi:DNA-binding NtrC family response regulator